MHMYMESPLVDWIHIYCISELAQKFSRIFLYFIQKNITSEMCKKLDVLRPKNLIHLIMHRSLKLFNIIHMYMESALSGLAKRLILPVQ